jgi:hypothetical protein
MDRLQVAALGVAGDCEHVAVVAGDHHPGVVQIDLRSTVFTASFRATASLRVRNALPA